MEQKCSNQILGESGSVSEKNEQIEVLKRIIEEKEKEAKEYYAHRAKLEADFEKYKKRLDREREEWTKFANEDLMKAILPFIDNLERAISYAEETENFQSLVEGLRLTIKQVQQSLNKFGLSRTVSIGKPFTEEFQKDYLKMEEIGSEKERSRLPEG